MITNEEKREFISKIYDFVPEGNTDATISNKLIQNKIMDMLMEDSNEGKLYKFRSVNKYSLKDLKRGTLYCASPSGFNDPFDCKIGLDIFSFFEARYEICFLKCTGLFNKYIDLYDCDNEPVGGYSEEEKKVLKYWSNNSLIQSYLKDDSKIISNSENEMQLFLDNIDFFIEMLRGFVLYKKYESETVELIKVFENGRGLKSTEIENKSFDTYKEILEDLVEKDGIENDADEISLIKLLHMSQKPNDTLKAKKMDEDLDKISKDLAKDIDKQFRVGCLSTTCKNHLMWSHYAAGHKGFCIEYDFSKGFDTKAPYMILPVIYSKERVKFPWRVALAENPEDSEIKLEGAYCKIFTLLSKDSVWEYEKEWRIILPCDAGTVNAKMPPISCIYVGAFCKEKDEKKLVKIAKKLNIPIKKMVIDRGDYSLHVQEL